MRTALLLDSGARSTMLNGEFATIMGIDLSEPQYEKIKIGGVVPGYGIRAAKATVLAYLGGRWIPPPVAFTLDPVTMDHLLGREVFFDQHLVAFARIESCSPPSR